MEKPEKVKRLSDTAIKALAPGQWIWSEGIGFRKNTIGHGGTWYIK